MNYGMGRPSAGRRRPTGILAGGLWFWLTMSVPVFAQAPRLELPKQDSNGNVTLVLQGQNQTNYTLEKSSDLANWVFLFSGAATNGTLSYVDASGNPAAPNFYRGRQSTNAPSGPPPRVKQTLDNDQRTLELVTTNQAILSLTNHQGVRFTLEVPANALLEPHVITMTVVTNLAGHPFDGTNLWAVAFEPEGLQFLTPALLSIDLPTSVPVELLASFWYTSDSTDFGLMPDVVWTNRVQFPIDHFSSYGAGTTGNAAYQAQANRSVLEPFQRLKQQVAVEVKQARDAGQLPFGDTALPPPVKNKVAALIKDFLEKRYGGADPNFLRDCAAVQGELPRPQNFVYLLARYGIAQSEVRPGIADMVNRLCGGASKCLDQAQADCQNNKPGAYQKFVQLDQALAAAKIGCSDTTNRSLAPCAPAWTGYIAYHAEGSTNYDLSEPLHHVAFAIKLAVDMVGIVTEDQDFEPAPGSHFFFLKVERRWAGAFKGSSTTEGWGCEGFSDYQNNLVSTMRKDWVNHTTTDTQTLTLALSGTNVTFTSSAGSIGTLLQGPVDQITTTTRENECDGTPAKFDVENETEHWRWSDTASLSPPKSVFVSSNQVLIRWTGTTTVEHSTPVAETCVLLLTKSQP